MLSPRQELTIMNLYERGITSPIDIIAFCVEKLAKPRMNKKLRLKKIHTRTNTRKHSRLHYQGIINHYAQGGE